MHKAVVFGSAQRLIHLVTRYVMTAVGLHHVVGHVTHCDTPVMRIVAATLAKGLAACTATAHRSSVLAIVLIQPVLNVLNGHRRALGINGLLHRNHVHANACASGRHHRHSLGKRALRSLLKELGKLGMLTQLIHAHVEELGRARYQHGQHPLLGARGVFPVVLQKARVRKLVEHG